VRAQNLAYASILPYLSTAAASYAPAAESDSRTPIEIWLRAGRGALLDLSILDEDERPRLDANFEEVTEGEKVGRKERLKSKWAATEAVVGSDKRVALVAQDLVEHFEERLEAMEGKAMVVCMSRRICVDLYTALVKLRPDWARRR
jgi:type I site-specific restriction-modification system R (restriction) subunit